MIMNYPVHLVVAVDQEFGIGKGGGLPWKLSGDLKKFKEITTSTRSPEKQNAVIMGRRTWDSLPEKFRPLPGRINCVLTRNPDLALPSALIKGSSLTAIIQQLKEKFGEGIEQVFVIGGGEVFRQCLKEIPCEKIYLTQLMSSFDCDTFFPRPLTGFKKTFQGELLTEAGISYRFEEYSVIKN